MASLALDPAYRRVTVDEFLRMDFGDAKAELIDGVIFMMAGAASRHNLVAANVLIALGMKLRGSGCRPYGSDQAVRIDERNIRYPDVSVYCGDASVPDDFKQLLLGDPRLIVEVLSQTTSHNDEHEKLAEYRSLDGVQCVLLISPETERVRRVQRNADGWSDGWRERGQDVRIDALDLTLTTADIFATD